MSRAWELSFLASNETKLSAEGSSSDRVQFYSVSFHPTLSYLPFSFFLSSPQRLVYVLLYTAVYTDVNVCVPLPLWYAFRGSGGKTESMYLRGCNAISFIYYYYFFLSYTANARAREFFSMESLTTKNALSISLYLIGCITGSMSHQPLYHCYSKYQVKAFAVSFSKDLCTAYKYI